MAALLARLEPAQRAKPKDVDNLHANEALDRAVRTKGARPAPGHRITSGGMVRFFINRGVNQGANPSRILAAICRRGQVHGSEIGSIAIHPNASTFDVSGEVAERFERLTGRRDKRDPQTVIRRDQGPKPGARARRS